MKIGVSGSHSVGKSTLVDELRQLLPQSTFVDEPYLHLLAEGHDFAATPSVDDIEAQLERSISLVSSHKVDALLRDILIEDEWGLGLAVIEVRGAPTERAGQARIWIRKCHGRLPRP